MNKINCFKFIFLCYKYTFKYFKATDVEKRILKEIKDKVSKILNQSAEDHVSKGKKKNN